MTDMQAHTETNATADRPAGASRRNDQAAEGERRSFREGGGAPAQSASRTGAFDAVRRDLQEARERSYWGPSLLSRQLEPLLRLQGDMIRWFDEAWRESANAWPIQRLGMLSAAPLLGLPAADIRETDRAYKLSVELPGLGREDVDLAIQDDVLLISGHKQEERQEAGAAYRLAERRYGRFERAFPLPPDVRREAIDATFNDGVLTVILPRTAQPRAERAQVKIKG